MMYLFENPKFGFYFVHSFQNNENIEGMLMITLENNLYDP